MFVLGIDPGLTRCGYGCVGRLRGTEVVRGAGVITTPPDAPLAERLAELRRELDGVVRECLPDVVALERVLFQTNARTAMSVGQASGIALLVAADAGVPVVEYSANEVKLAVAARDVLAAEGISARVVSMPSVEWFRQQDASYQEEVLPAAVRARVSVEAGITPPWKGIVGDCGESVGIDHYGASAAEAVLSAEFGITADAVAAAARTSLARARA